MLNRILKSLREAPAPAASVPPGTRVYAIGDIHGRLDLLDRLLAKIDADDSARGPAATQLVFLGDLLDRGPDSAGAVERLRRLALAIPESRFLLGNHEEVFLGALDGDERMLKLFCRIGGRETALSYGLSATEYEQLDFAELAAQLTALVPPAHRDFLAGFEDLIVIGDYAFVHAGIRPGVALDEQKRSDLRWIRDPFLTHRGPLEKIIVHGHTITETVEMRPNRIGIDTGAYADGPLSALGLEGGERWVLAS